MKRPGAVEVSRNVYQSSQGGAIFCPLDQNARIVVTLTPLYARMVSWKYTHMASSEVCEDLKRNHGRKALRSVLRDLADVVASIAQTKEEAWDYNIPELPGSVKTVALGLDGANL